jgi:hypothetical protein
MEGEGPCPSCGRDTENESMIGDALDKSNQDSIIGMNSEFIFKILHMKKLLDDWIDYWNIRKIPSLELESMIPKLILIPLMKSTTNGTLFLLFFFPLSSFSLLILSHLFRSSAQERGLAARSHQEMERREVLGYLMLGRS